MVGWSMRFLLGGFDAQVVVFVWANQIEVTTVAFDNYLSFDCRPKLALH